MLDFIQNSPDLIRWVVTLSAIIFLCTLVLVPFLITRIPDDYFHENRRGKTSLSAQHPLLRLLILISKNLLGYGLLLLGIMLLFLPGQGLLTMLVGIILMDYPMKYRLERWMVKRKNVLNAMNWLRKHANKNPLQLS